MIGWLESNKGLANEDDVVYPLYDAQKKYEVRKIMHGWMDYIELG